MTTLHECTTLVLDRDATWSGPFATEPAEAAWAGEAIFFVRALAAPGNTGAPPVTARVEISPDGIRWCAEGTTLALPAAPDAVTFCRVTHFGGWLRLTGNIPAGAERAVIAYLVLKA